KDTFLEALGDSIAPPEVPSGSEWRGNWDGAADYAWQSISDNTAIVIHNTDSLIRRDFQLFLLMLEFLINLQIQLKHYGEKVILLRIILVDDGSFFPPPAAGQSEVSR
ncbi:MAG: hypothetical protein N2C14_31490, partial [Planctomycetales bacterium]